MGKDIEITVRPEASTWGGLLRSRAPVDGRAQRFPEELGLPGDRPVIMSGHQAQVWHPGILAKLMAARSAAKLSAAAVAWLVVDQDDHEPWEIRYPVRRGDGRLESRIWRMDGGERGGNDHVPTA